MKLSAKRLLSFLLILSLFAAFLSIGVFAVDLPEISCDLGAALDYTIPLDEGVTATGFELVSGSLPSGVDPTLKDGAVKLLGTPSASGDYSCEIKVTFADGAESYTVTLHVTEPAPTPTPAPTPEPTPVPVTPTITEDPSAKTVKEGGTCYFTARADDAIEIIWRLEGPNGETIDAEDLRGDTRFKGAYANGYDEETLELNSIPYELNGWKAVCKFIGAGNNSAISKGALITVEQLPPTVTKDPTAETVMEGGTCYFIARADDAIEIIWRLEGPNGETIDAEDLRGDTRFKGAYANGYDEETLELNSIPYELNGWKAVCKFIGAGNTSAFSKGALITVEKGGLMRPSITKDPFVTTDSDTLSVVASDPNGGTLYYQWYSSTKNSSANTDGQDVAIPGATSATYVPPETEGTVYYYCTVWSVKDGQESSRTTSRVAAVTHAPAATPEPTAAPTPAPAETVSPSPASNTSSRNTQRNSASRFLLILMGVLILALIAAAVSLVIISRREKELDEADERAARAAARAEAERSRAAVSSQVSAAASSHAATLDDAKEKLMRREEKYAAPVAAPEEDGETQSSEEAPAQADEDSADPESFTLNGWYCEKCGAFNRGRICGTCGADKPKDAIPYVCDNCGWTNPDPEHPPRFCPDCGKPFAAEGREG